MARTLVFYTHAFGGGGAEVVFGRLAASMAEGGDRVTVVADHADAPLPCSTPHLRHVLLKGGHLRSTLQLAFLLRRERPTASFSALGAQNIKHCAAALLACRLRSCVLGYHGFAAAEPKPLAQMAFYGAWLLTRMAARSICVSDALLLDLRNSWHASSQRTIRIHNPVTPPDPLLPIADDGPPLIVACGRMVPIKRLPLLVEAFAAVTVPGARLAILGDGPDRAAVEHVIEKTAQEDRVELVGAVADPAPWYRRARCVAIASDSESFGLTAAEALSYGIPVVSTDCGGPREILDGGCGRLVPRGDAAALAKALTETLLQAGNAAPRLARAKDFALPKIRDAYLGLADELAGADAKRRSQ